jgi:hypothetical protein
VVPAIVVAAGGTGCSSATDAGAGTGLGASTTASVVPVALPIVAVLVMNQTTKNQTTKNQTTKPPRNPMAVKVVKRGSILVFAKEVEPGDSGTAVEPPTAGAPLRRCAPYTYWAPDVGSAVVTTTFTKPHFGHNDLGLVIKVVDR